jgi:hypothetical protein
MSKVRIDFSANVRDFDWYLSRLDLDGARLIDERDVLCRCPAHEDYTPSLHLREDDHGLLVYCFAGCTQGEITEALEDAEPKPRPKLARVIPARERGTVVATYDYRNAEGELVFRKLRLDPKSFEFRRPVIVPARTSGPVQHSEYVSWRAGLKDAEGRYVVEPIPYNLPELLASDEAFVVDGEKDSDRLAAEGIVATCSPYGMARWKPEWDEYLTDKHVTVVADRDESGYRAAAEIAARVEGIAASVRVVEAAEGKDAFDHLEAGYSLSDFAEVALV